MVPTCSGPVTERNRSNREEGEVGVSLDQDEKKGRQGLVRFVQDLGNCNEKRDEIWTNGVCKGTE